MREQRAKIADGGSAAFMPLQPTHRLVRPFFTRARWQIRPVKRHKCRAPIAALAAVLALVSGGCRHGRANYGPAAAYADLENKTNFNSVKLPNERDPNWLQPP